jgi:amidophosphoribosyltransferase
VFAQINDRVNEEMAAHPEYADNVAKSKYSVCRGVLGHVRDIWKNNSIKVSIRFTKQLDTQESIVLWKFQ